MEAIDAGDVPLDRVVRQLFSANGLKELIGHHGAACFVMARSGLVPEFYMQLIENVHTIDATTRQHIAFIVFHGKHSSLLTEHGGRTYEYHVEGLSVSKGNWIRLDREEPRLDLRFDRHLTDDWRINPRSSAIPSISRATELAATFLMERFGVRETMLPCLLFVDGRRMDEPQIIRLAPKQPMKSLYKDVLAPLSDEFQNLETYWQLCRKIESHKRELSYAREARETINEFAPKLRELEGAVAAANAKVDTAGKPSGEIPALEQQRAALQALCSRYKAAKTLDERVALVTQSDVGYEQVQLYEARLVALEEEKPSVYTPPLSDDERQRYAQLSSSVNRIRGKLGTAAAQPYLRNRETLDQIEARLVHLERAHEPLIRELEAATQKIQWLIQGKESAERTLARPAEFDLAEAQDRVARSYADLKAQGFGDEVLQNAQPAAIDVIKTLLARNRIGAFRSATDNGCGKLRILFLAANPRETTQLDLEEELRAITLELRGTRYRERIELLARHAVRTDDLLRYIREDAPEIVHFSGHGTTDGIVLRDDVGGYRIVRGEALSRLLSNRSVKLVILNSCYSDEQGKSLATAVETVIGTTSELGDEAARRFSIAFYRTLGDGNSVGDAFRDGGDTLSLHDLQDVYHLLGRADRRLAVGNGSEDLR